jgi:hypothetical protein
MSQRPFTRALAVVAILALVVTPAFAQSGRGRQLQIMQQLNPEPSVQTAEETGGNTNVSDVTGVLTNPKNSSPVRGINLPPVQDPRSIALIYNNNAANQPNKKSGDYHVTKGDKIAGWILLGWFAAMAAIEISNDGDF